MMVGARRGENRSRTHGVRRHDASPEYARQRGKDTRRVGGWRDAGVRALATFSGGLGGGSTALFTTACQRSRIRPRSRNQLVFLG
jgi:hypothetical protein